MAEFIQRKRLAELGFVSRLEDLGADKAQVLLEISQEFDRLEAEESKRRMAQSQMKRGRH